MTTPLTEYDNLIGSSTFPPPTLPPNGTHPEAPTRPRPPSIHVPSDDCEIEYDGRTYTPHIGEWVRVVPVRRVGDAEVFHNIHQLETVIAAAKGDADEGKKITAAVARQSAGLIGFLKGRVVAWNWTEWTTGEPLPPPGPDVFRQLTDAELLWLVSAIQQNNPARRKNA